jgi:hypothetical protein
MFHQFNNFFSSPARRLLARLFLVVSVLHAGGFDLLLLQCVAWANMTVSYSQEVGFKQGLNQTFDGNHPCALCCAIRKQEVDRQSILPELGPKKQLPSRLQLFSLPEAPQRSPGEWIAAKTWQELLPDAPETPPPICD